MRCRTSGVPIETQYQKLVGKPFYVTHEGKHYLCSKCNKSFYAWSKRKTHENSWQNSSVLKVKPRKGYFFRKGDTWTPKKYADTKYAGSVTDKQNGLSS